jgi:hypothetical protein
MSDQLFQQTPEANQEQVQPSVTAEDLVGDGKKYSDVDALAKSYKHADDFIETLKADNQRLREQTEALSAQVGNLSDLDKRLESLSSQASEPQVEAHQPSEIGDDAKDERSIADLVRKELEQAKEQDLMNNNLGRVEQALLSKFGDEEAAKKGFAELANEYGTTTELLLEVGVKSPQAIEKMLGTSDSAKAPTSSPMGSTVNTENKNFTGNNKQGTYSWYKQQYGSKIYTDTNLANEIATKSLNDPEFLNT